MKSDSKLYFLIIVVLCILALSYKFYEYQGEKELTCEKIQNLYLVVFDDEKEIVSIVEGDKIEEISSEKEDLIKFNIDGKFTYIEKSEDYQIVENEKEICK